MSKTIHAPARGSAPGHAPGSAPGTTVPPSLCVLLELALKHRILEPEDILAMGAVHRTDHRAVIDACEAAARGRGSAALDGQLAKCRSMIG